MATAAPRTDLDAGAAAVRAAPRRVAQQDVLGLQVPVDDPSGPQDPHGPRDLLQEDPDGVLAQRPLTCTGEHSSLANRLAGGGAGGC